MANIKFSLPKFSTDNLGKGTIFDPEEWKRFGDQLGRAPQHLENFANDFSKDPLKALANTLLPAAVIVADPTAPIPATTSPNDPGKKRQEAIKNLDEVTKEVANIGSKYLLYAAAAAAGILILTRSRN